MALTPRQERYRDNMRRARKIAADNLKAARKLHQQGDKQGTEFLEKYRRAVDWGARNPNPNRRAERRASFTPQQWVQGEEMLKTLRDGIINTYALADAVRY